MYIFIGIICILILGVAIYLTITIANNQDENDYQPKTKERYKRLLTYYLIGALIGMGIYLVYLVQ